MNTLQIAIGFAVAAAVLAVVVLVRRGQTVRVGRRNLGPSADFSALIRLTESAHEGAAIASELRDQCHEPWSWQLESGLEQVESDAAKRLLLNGLIDLQLGIVTTFSPREGDVFESPKMQTSDVINSDDIWLVAADTPVEQQGYTRGSRTLVKANVEVCTADWFVLSRPGCVVGEAVVARADELIGGGPKRYRLWRAPWGFTFPEDLRALPEAALDEWRNRMIAELNPYYQGRPERQLKLIGLPGDAFDSAMESVSESQPLGDAIVDKIAVRDGIPQYGLVCPDGNPLLLAVVWTTPARTGS